MQMIKILKKKSRDKMKQSLKSSRQRNSMRTGQIGKGFEEDEETMPTWKIFMIIGIVVLCFAILYPHVIGPLISSYFSPKSSQKRSTLQPTSPVHPALNNARAGGPRPGGPNMHSAFRMAGQNQQAETSSIRGGAFGWLLPFYTVGVMVFLVYTLYKMMYGGKGRKSKKRHHRNYYDSDYDDDSVDEDDGDEDEDDIDNMSSKKMKKLQCQLKETEMAMTKILMQLENMQNMEILAQQTLQVNRNNDNGEKEVENRDSLQKRLNNNVNDIKKTLDDFHSLNKFCSDLKEISKHNELRRMTVNHGNSSSDDEDDFENCDNQSNEELRNSKTIEISKESLEKETTNDDIESNNDDQSNNNNLKEDTPNEINEYELTTINTNEENIPIHVDYKKNIKDNLDERSDDDKLSNNNENINNVTKVSRKGKSKKHSRREK
uniref:RIC3 domain-containing protein n=1 Tax=Strongyloides papillosus TaxID=174720 RepID=A0A0N5C0Z1_STREA